MVLKRSDVRTLGELLGMYDNEGELASRIRSSQGLWRSPVVQLAEGAQGQQWIAFGVPDDYERKPIQKWGWEQVIPPDTLLQDFMRIDAADDALTFAERYGPLWVCHRHTDLRKANLCRWREIPSASFSECEWNTGEPVQVWLACARQVRAAVRLLTILRSEVITFDIRTWADLFLLSDLEDPPPAITDLLVTLSVISDEIAKHYLCWLITGGGVSDAWGTRVRLTPDFRIELDTGLGFLPLVWLAVAGEAGDAHSLLICDNCRNLYSPAAGTRNPRVGQKNFCEDCGRARQYAPSKRETARSRRYRLRELADFLLEIDPCDPDQSRIAWNQIHPSETYDSDNRYCVDIQQILRRTYGVPTQKKAAQLQARLAPYTANLPHKGEGH